MSKRQALKPRLFQKMKGTTETHSVTDSTGDVFADLGLPNSNEELVRPELAQVVRSIAAKYKFFIPKPETGISSMRARLKHGSGGRSSIRKEHAGGASDKPDVGSALMATENALRDLISSTLSDTYGVDWENKLGVKAETIRDWRRRMEVEKKRLSTGLLDFRALSFAEFGDLKRIITKNWSLFESVFQGGQTEFEVFLTKLEGFRNPDAHNRGLLPFQKYLAQGICGHIRSEITRYRSRKDTVKNCFPQIESAFDNHGQRFPMERADNARLCEKP